MLFSYDEVDPSWHELFSKHEEELNLILSQLDLSLVTPLRSNIFRAFRVPVDDVKVVIFGQDPYPGSGVADGLAFSSPSANPIPASLRNIFIEYSDDLALAAPTSPDLSAWAENGVLLLNRTLTTSPGERNAHLDKGWVRFTLEVAKFLGASDVVAILWGNYARELAPYFQHRIESAHPSPLSARRGFFQSRPFTRSNALLRSLNRSEVDWSL